MEFTWVYLGTGHVSRKYHVVFYNEFSTVRHLHEGTVPKNWRELVESSSFSSTDQQYYLAETWLNQNALDHDDPDSATPLSIPTSLPSISVAGRLALSSASNSLVFAGVPTGSLAVEPTHFVSVGDFLTSPSMGAKSPVPSQLPACKGEDLTMPEFFNIETAGLCCSARAHKKSTKALEIDQTSETKKLSQFNFFNFFEGSNLYFSLAKHRAVMQNFSFSNRAIILHSFSSLYTSYQHAF